MVTNSGPADSQNQHKTKTKTYWQLQSRRVRSMTEMRNWMSNRKMYCSPRPVDYAAPGTPPPLATKAFSSTTNAPCLHRAAAVDIASDTEIE